MGGPIFTYNHKKENNFLFVSIAIRRNMWSVEWECTEFAVPKLQTMYSAIQQESNVLIMQQSAVP